jgi:DNA polymerase III subunit delta'
MSVLEPAEQHDTLPGIAAPVLTRQIFGHEVRLSFLAHSHAVGRLHHALLFEGPNGVGKSTSAFHLAQHLIANPIASRARESLELLNPAGGDFRQLANGTHLQVLHLTRPFDPKSEKFKTMLTVDEVRRIGHFLSRTNTGAGYRVVIIDPADEMNTAAANALLKNLEEPPLRTVFILISHGSGRLLPTIRSRCQALQFNALGHNDLKAAIEGAISGAEPTSDELLSLSEGSVRRALTLLAFGGLEIVKTANQLVEAHKFDADKTAKLADAMIGRDAEIQYQLLANHLLSRISAEASDRASANDMRSALKLSELHSENARMLKDAQVFNLDRKQTVFGLIASLQGKFDGGVL